MQRRPIFFYAAPGDPEETGGDGGKATEAPRPASRSPTTNKPAESHRTGGNKHDKGPAGATNKPTTTKPGKDDGGAGDGGGVMASVVPYVGVEEVKDVVHLAKCCLAEFLGVMFLVLIGCGACLVHDEGGADVVRIALAFGLTVAACAQAFGHVSGCHINPAVTAGLFVGRKIGAIKAAIYVVVQCVGGIAGAGLLKGLTTDSVGGVDALGASVPNKTLGITGGQALGIEFLITFVLVIVVYGSAADDNNAPSVKGSAPLAIGLSITVAHLFAVPLTGSGMNPARSLGPAIVAEIYTDHWAYWVGPILGGVCAGLVYQLAFQAPPPAKTRQTTDGEYLEVQKVDK